MHDLYAEVQDDRYYRHCEHPMTATGLVLLSAAILGTTNPTKLVLFAGYSRQFISAISFNMENNQLWVNGHYQASSWLSSDGKIDERRFWDHIEFGCSTTTIPTCDKETVIDACSLFWDEHNLVGRRSGVIEDVLSISALTAFPTELR